MIEAWHSDKNGDLVIARGSNMVVIPATLIDEVIEKMKKNNSSEGDCSSWKIEEN